MKWASYLPLPTPKPPNTQAISNTPCLLVCAIKPDFDTKRNKIMLSLELRLTMEASEHVSNCNTGLWSAIHRAVYIAFEFRHTVLRNDWQGFVRADYHPLQSLRGRAVAEGGGCCGTAAVLPPFFVQQTKPEPRTVTNLAQGFSSLPPLLPMVLQAHTAFLRYWFFFYSF